MSDSKKSKILNLAIIGVLLAMEIILSRFLSISMWNMKIGFAFIPVVIAARRFGAPHAMIIGGLGDFLGAILFPIGAYFPGFTLTAVLTGLCTAVFIHKKCSLKRIIMSVAINQVVGSLILNSLWISILYQSPFWALVPTRIVQTVVMTVVQVVVMQLIFVKGDKLITKRHLA